MRVWWRRLRVWWLLGLALLILGAVPVLAPVWLPGAMASSVVGLVTAIAGVVAARGRGAIDRRAEQVRAVPEQMWTGEGGRILRVHDVGDPIAIGVHPAADRVGGSRVPAYLERDITQRVHDAVRARGFVLLVGESTAGKSRAAYEAMSALVPDHRFVYPSGREGLGGVVAVVLECRRCVVWLDDLERYLGAGGLTAPMVARMLGEGTRDVLILATMRAQEYAQYSPRLASRSEEAGRELIRAGRDVLRLARQIPVERRWSPTELSSAKAYRDDPQIAEALEHADRFGVAEYLAAGPQLLAEWRDAWSPGHHPRGAALVSAAVDARRAGLHTPINIQLLTELHHCYLDDRGGPVLRPEPFDQALRWATEALHATSSLLLPMEDNRYIAFDYLPDILNADPNAPPIPDSSWRLLIEHSGLADVFEIGQVAYTRRHLGHALDAFRRAADAGNADATLWIARTTAETGHPLDAERFLREVAVERSQRLGNDHPDTLSCRHELAYLMAETGHKKAGAALADAVARDRARVLGSDHPDTLRSRHRLASLTGWGGDNNTACRIHQQLAEDRARILGVDHSDTLRSRQDLANEIGYNGNPARAVQLLGTVINDRVRVLGADHPDTLWSRFHLARWSGRAGDPAAAVQLYTALVADRIRVQGRNHPETLDARHELGFWTMHAGDADAAFDQLRELVDDRSKVLGHDHRATLRSRVLVARWTAEHDDLSSAISLLVAIAAAQTRILGIDHEETRDSQHQLEDWTLRWSAVSDPTTRTLPGQASI